MPCEWGTSPKASVQAECERRGETVVGSCVAILEGRSLDASLLFALAGPAAHQVLDGGEGGLSGYWPRVWALRGLRHVWDDSATRCVIDATDDDSWRVREMTTKVVAAHQVDEALESMARLQEDPNPRVRSAAARAVRALVDQRD